MMLEQEQHVVDQHAATAAAATSTLPAPTGVVSTTSSNLDALPYIDPIHEDYEQYALALIEAEMQQQHQKMDHAVVPNKMPARHVHRSLLFQEAVQQLSGHGDDDDDGDDDQRQEPPPSKKRTRKLVPDRLTFPTAPSSSEDDNAWHDAVRQAKIAYESERLRALRLELQNDGDPAGSLWKTYTDNVLQPQYHAAQEQLATQRRAVEEVNGARQVHQTTTLGRPLHVWTVQYEELLEKQRQLKQAIAQLEEEEKSNQL